MRPIREITAEEEDFRIESSGGFNMIRRDPVEPEPVGSILLIPFRIVGYDQDCDGSLMARLENIDAEGEQTGWDAKRVGLYGGGLVVTAEELRALMKPES